MKKPYRQIIREGIRRRATVRRLRALNWTLERIGKRLNISRQRVGQLLK